MAIFGRQKRQPRTYWAELGFMVLGLLGLQPTLFMSLLQGTPEKVVNYAQQNGYSVSPQSLETFRDWTGSQITGLLPHSQQGPMNTQNGWAPVPVQARGTLPSTSYIPNSYMAPQPMMQPFTTQNGYSQQNGYTQQNVYSPAATYTQQPTAYGQAGGQYLQPSNGQLGFSQADNRYPNHFQNNSSMTGQTSANSYPPNQFQTAQHPAVGPQTGFGYNNQYSANPNVYGNGTYQGQGYNVPPSNQQPFYGGSTLNANANPYGAPGPNTLNNSHNSSNTWSRATPLSSPSSYSASQFNGSQANPGAWQRYQPANSPLYR